MKNRAPLSSSPCWRIALLCVVGVIAPACKDFTPGAPGGDAGTISVGKAGTGGGGGSGGRVAVTGSGGEVVGDSGMIIVDATVSTGGSEGSTIPDAAVIDAAVVDTSVVDSAGGDVPIACGPGQKSCSGSCVNIDDPKYGCDTSTCDSAACPNVPGATLVCEGSACVIGTCGAGTKNCANRCVNVADPLYGCGASTCDATSCPNPGAGGSVTCQAGACVISTCGAGSKKCGTKCVAVSDPTFGCGASTCDATACPAAGTGTLICQGGACMIGSCGAGTKKCGDKCVPTDKNNGCGDVARCTACAATEACGGAPITQCQCVPTPMATACAGKCDTVSNGCGGTYTCATCAAPLKCGPANTCICTASATVCCANGDCTSGGVGTVGTCTNHACSYACAAPTYRACGSACVLAALPNCCSNTDCPAATPVCNASKKCVARAQGQACTTTAECGTDHCVNGVCCASTSCPTCQTCNGATPGTCMATTAAMSCSDGDSCTLNDSCQSGACRGTLMSCPPPAACHAAGTCTSGACTTPNLANGATDTKCPTSTRVCFGGACVQCTTDQNCPATAPSCNTSTHKCGCQQPSPGNVFKNPGFSQVLGLSLWVFAPEATVVFSNDDADGCLQSGSAHSDPSVSGDLQTCVPVLGNTHYFFGAKFKGWGSCDAILNVDTTCSTPFNFGASTSLGGTSSPGPTNWTSVTSDFTTDISVRGLLIDCILNGGSIDQLYINTVNSY